MSELPTWERRFRAPLLSFPAWATDAPDRLVIASTESGSYQLHTWDRVTGERRQVTARPGRRARGPADAATGPASIWFHDATGAESGQLGGGAVRRARSRPEPLLEGVPEGWAEGLAIGPAAHGRRAQHRGGVLGLGRRSDGGAARLLHEHPQPFGSPAAGAWPAPSTAGRSRADESMRRARGHGGRRRAPSVAARRSTPRTGATVAELRDEGRQLSRLRVLAGRGRHADRHRARAHRRASGPALWDVAHAARSRDLPLDLDGPVEPADWWPDGSALLLLQLVDGRHRLHRYDLATGATTPLDTEPGSITAAAVRPDGEVWYRVHNGLAPGAAPARSARTTPLLEPDGAAAPAGRPFEAWWFDNPNGQRVHGFLVRPDGRRPAPGDHAGPRRPALARHGPLGAGHPGARRRRASSSRWSTTAAPTGFGQAWRDELTGNVGFLELEDVLAGLDDLVARGLADPARVVLAGWSWGGYVTLLGIGRHPDRWISAIGGVPGRGLRGGVRGRGADRSRRSTGRCSAARPRRRPTCTASATRSPTRTPCGCRC